MNSLSGVRRAYRDCSNPVDSAAFHGEAPAGPPAHASSREGWTRRFLRGRFLRFLFVGGLNTAFSYVLFAACILIGLTYPIAALLATVISVLFNFKSYGMLVFGSRDGSRLFRFFVVYALVYGVGVLLLRIASAHNVSVLLAAAVFALPMAAFSFTLNRLFVFHHPK